MKTLIPVVIILAGFLIMKGLVISRTEPKKEIRKDAGALVRIMEAEKQQTTVFIKSTGTVKAKHEVTVTPQVSGKVTYVAPEMVVGGFFLKDEILFKIEDADYILALEQAQAAKARAEYDLATIQSQARIARSEWERINKDAKSKPNPLVLYEPQLNSATAALASAIASVEKARLDLERTKLKAPFNSRVRSENIDIGQYIRSGSSVAVLAGTDTADVFIPLPQDELHWIDIPGEGEKYKGSRATISVNTGRVTHEWFGNIVRSTGEVDTRSRMMQIIVKIEDPYGLELSENDARPVLAFGTFVDVKLEGKPLDDIFIIPRAALRDNSTVWIMDSKDKLRVKKVNVIRLEKDKVMISRGLRDGEKIILTSIVGAADGMKLRVMK